MNNLGANIKFVRKKNLLTQRDLGEMMTVTAGYISKVETGKEIPTPMFIKLFCLLFSINEEQLKN